MVNMMVKAGMYLAGLSPVNFVNTAKIMDNTMNSVSSWVGYPELIEDKGLMVQITGLGAPAITPYITSISSVTPIQLAHQSSLRHNELQGLVVSAKYSTQKM